MQTEFVGHKSKRMYAWDEYKISHSSYSGMSTNREKRQAIVTALAGKVVGVNHSQLNKGVVTDLTTELEVSNPGLIGSEAFVSGITWAIAHVEYPLTADTYKVEAGKQVCFDTITGKCVTGIHPTWYSDEYREVGIALESFVPTGESKQYKRIPILVENRKKDNKTLFKASGSAVVVGPPWTTEVTQWTQLQPIPAIGLTHQISSYVLSTLIAGWYQYHVRVQISVPPGMYDYVNPISIILGATGGKVLAILNEDFSEKHTLSAKGASGIFYLDASDIINLSVWHLTTGDPSTGDQATVSGIYLDLARHNVE